MRLAFEANIYTASKYMCIVCCECSHACMHIYIYMFAIFAGSLGPDILHINTTVGLSTSLRQFEP